MMSPKKKRLLWIGGFLGVAVLIGSGCSSDTKSVRERYVPKVETAQRALEIVLTEWREGRSEITISGQEVTIHVADTLRKPGQILEKFEILGESPVDAGRGFVVRVELSNPDAVEKLRYLVLGIDPLWVFRQEDYEILTKWSCTGQEASPPKSADDESSSTVAEHTETHESKTSSADEPADPATAIDEISEIRVEASQPGEPGSSQK